MTYINKNSLKTLLPRAAQKSCPECKGKGMVWNTMTKDPKGHCFVFCVECLSVERVTSLWNWIADRLVHQEKRRNRSRISS